MTHSESVRSIRNRLFLLLLRAFGIVVVFIILFTLLVTGLVLTNPSRSNPLYRLPTISRLETYYIARGSWDGVSAIFTNSLDIEISQWKASILLDANDRVIVEHGIQVTPALSLTYQPASGETVIPILVNGAVVGKLVVRTKHPAIGEALRIPLAPASAAGITDPGSLCHFDRHAVDAPRGHTPGRGHRRGRGDRWRPFADTPRLKRTGRLARLERQF